MDSAADRWAERTADTLLETRDDVDPGEAAAAPNCPRCLTPMGLAGPDDAPRWECASCGATS